jgi:hypothetical protein
MGCVAPNVCELWSGDVAVIYVKIKSQKLPGVTEETEEKYQLK